MRLSSGGPEATGSTLSAGKHPAQFKGVGEHRADGLLSHHISLLLTQFLFRHSKLDAHSCCLRHVFTFVCFIILEFQQIWLKE